MRLHASARLSRLERLVAENLREEESAGKLLAMAHDPCLIFEMLGYDPDPWMVDLLETLTGPNPPKRIVACSGRQTGKSTFVSIFAAWSMICRGHRIGLAAPSYRQSCELATKVRRNLSTLGMVGRIKDNLLDTVLSNGGRLVVLSSDPSTARGFSLDLVAMDEIAFFAQAGADNLLTALAPTLSTTDGSIFLASSPGPPQGLLYDSWTSDLWHKVAVSSEDCPRISKEFLASQKLVLGERRYAAEYLGQFVENSGMLLEQSEILAAATAQPASDDYQW